jgi:hypothetical protein
MQNFKKFVSHAVLARLRRALGHQFAPIRTDFSLIRVNSR